MKRHIGGRFSVPTDRTDNEDHFIPVRPNHRLVLVNITFRHLNKIGSPDAFPSFLIVGLGLIALSPVAVGPDQSAVADHSDPLPWTQVVLYSALVFVRV